jgi:hypothetical protein
MKTFVIGMAAAAALLSAAPAFAQDFRVRAGDGGISVGVDSDRGYDRPRRGDRDVRIYDRGYDRPSTRIYARGDCRDVTVRRRLPDGSVVVRHRRECD